MSQCSEGKLQGVAIFGSTGSIGVSTLDVISRHPDRYRVVVLAAHRNVATLKAQCLQFKPEFAALADVAAARQLKSLVMAGDLFMQAVHEGGAQLVPIDSEHNAIFQCLPDNGGQINQPQPGVKRLLLTASGGPFLRMPATELAGVTPAQACAHPRWVMGRKISVDSATLMNKGLELIEASLLFAIPSGRIEVMVHPQSIVHSMVEYIDGSLLAQLGNPDMRTPIAYGLGWPERLTAGVESLDLIRAGRLEFEEPDEMRFPCLRLARQAAESGDSYPAVLNAANEVAVAAFLNGQLGFTGIPSLVESVLDEHTVTKATSLHSLWRLACWYPFMSTVTSGLRASWVFAY